ncbi:hypothetical protein M426DRAFT_322350 [Hypoxylon sp. CI-4A]|nr:hypothetical protein M426DRAFT_322350 [Hypoxylon sp. CI-4A]
MASQQQQYGVLTPIQQYNQLPFSVIPAASQSQPQPQLPPQAQLQQLQPQPASESTVPATYQQPQLHPPPPPALPPSANIVAQQQTVTTNSNGAISTIPPTTTDDVPSEPQRKRRRVGRPPKSQTIPTHLSQQHPPNLSLPPQPPQPQPQPQIHTPHPLNKGPYQTAEDAVFSLQLHVFTSGYGVSQKRTVKEKLASGRYDPAGPVIRKDFSCDRGGSEFVSQSTGERRRESKKCGCPWKAVARRLKREGDRWFVDVLDPRHNHPATPPERMHTIASYRRWQRENGAGVRGAVGRLARAAAMPAKRVADYLKGVVVDPDLDRVDRQILRALSIGDVEVPPPPPPPHGDAGAAQSVTVFDVVAGRPTIILQENVLPSSAATVGGARAGVGGVG